MVTTLRQGWCQEFSFGMAESSDEEANIWFSGYYECQVSRKVAFHLLMGASML